MDEKVKVNYGGKTVEISTKPIDDMLSDLFVKFMDELIRVAKETDGRLTVDDLEEFKVELMECFKEDNEVQSHQA